MNNSNNTPEKAKNTRVHTKLKFVKSDVSGVPVSFVSQNPITGRICGVRQDSEHPKKIAIADKFLANEIIDNVLYDCTLIPMADKNGYVVIQAEPCQFKATVSTTCIKNTIYRVEVKFGNKTIKFDPFSGHKESVRDFSKCKGVLEKRMDVQNLMQVVGDFERAANHLVAVMEYDRFRKR